MPKPHNTSLSSKLAGVGVVLLVVALTSIGLTLWVTWQLEGGAASVNEAGRMRMQTWRMASEIQAGISEEQRMTHKVGLFRTDSGFYDKVIVAWLKAKKISHIISARLTTALQQAIVDQCKWQQVEVGLEVSELSYQPHGWDTPQRLVVVRQHIKRKNGAVAAKETLHNSA